MESATIIIFFARLEHFQGERGVVKKSTLCTLVIMMKKMDAKTDLITSRERICYFEQPNPALIMTILP
jgi:hypothetical protein